MLNIHFGEWENVQYGPSWFKYNYKPELVFDATSCGENCAPWLLEIGNKIDVTVNLEYLMTFEKNSSFKVFIENEKRVVTDIDDYMITAMKYL